MTRIERTRHDTIETALRMAQWLREALLRMGGVQVALTLMVAMNALTATFLFIGSYSLFGPPATDTEMRSTAARLVWNGFTGRADVTLLFVAMLLLLGIRQGDTVLLWWVSAASAALWAGLFVFMWLAYFYNGGTLSGTHFNTLVPISAACFVCLRLSAESASAGVPLSLCALFSCSGEKRRRLRDRRKYRGRNE